MGSKWIVLFAAALGVVFALIASGQAQRAKPGACPPSTGIGICAFTCNSDFECPGPQKCCRTGCGGTSCSSPVTRLAGSGPPAVKKGECPAEPTGPWVCSHMCTTDADCRGRLKCCRNRCKALTCQKPEQ